MTIDKGAIKITGYIAPTSELDTYPTHKEEYGLGGHRSVADYTALLAISEDRRSVGMTVFVRDTNTLYQLIGNNTSDNNWIPILNYDNNKNITFENIACKENYVLAGNAAGIAQASPILIDMKLDMRDIRLSKPIVAGNPTPVFPEGRFLGTYANGFLYNQGGELSTLNALPPSDIAIPEGQLLTGDTQGKAVATQQITIHNLPPLGTALVPPAEAVAGQIWRGTPDGKAELSNALTVAESDILALNARFALTHFVQNSRTLSSPLMPASQYLSDLVTTGIAKINQPDGLFSIAVERIDYGNCSGLGNVSVVGNIAIWADTIERTITDSGFSLPDLQALAAEATAAAATSTAAATSSATSASTATAAATTATTAATTATTEAAAATTAAETAALAAETATTAATTATTAATTCTTAATTATGAATEATGAAATATGAATEATASAAEATGAAATASAAATEATGAAATATGAAAAAAISATAASGSASSASSSASDASDSANNAADSATSSSNSATAAANTYAAILATGLNSLPNHGDINFNNYKGINVADPVNPQDIATKSYADAIASGINFHNTTSAATTTNLTAIYNNGVAGNGATLTNNGVLAAFSIDGVTPNINARILVKNQTFTEENGVYTLTTVGSASVAWILTRAADYNAPPEVASGDIIPVENGTTNGKTSWLQTATVTTIGTDPILFTQFSYAPTSFLLAANNLSDLNNVSTARTNLGLTEVATQTITENAVLQGGASNTIVSRNLTNGQILIGNTLGAPTAALPSNGTNISWSGGAGTLTANLTGQVGVANGGTGISSTTPYGVLCGGSTSSGNLQNAGTGAAGQVFTSAGAGALPTWQNASVGTVTSVAATTSSAGLSISGSPITSSGTLTFSLNTQLQNLSAVASTGFITQTDKSGTFVNRSIAVGSSGNLIITNGDGVSGNPAIDLNSSITNMSFIGVTSAGGGTLLNLSGNKISSSGGTSNGNLYLETGGVGTVVCTSGVTITGQGGQSILIMYNPTNTFFTAFRSTATQNIIYDLPATDSTGVQALISNGSGKLSWASFGTGNVTSVALSTTSTGLSISGSPITSSGTIDINLNDELQALAGANSNGFVVRTDTKTYTRRSITVSSDLTVSNSDGVAGNPTLGLATTGVTAGTYNNVAVDAKGRVTSGSNVSIAPTAARYILQQNDSNLPNAQSLGALTSGLLKNTVTSTTGVLSTATAGVDYYAPNFPTVIQETYGGLNNLYIGGGITGTPTSGAQQNTAFGIENQVGNLRSGTNNSSLGYQALKSITFAGFCTAMGAQAGLNNVTDSFTAFGSSAGRSNTFGADICVGGRRSLFNSTNSSRITAWGNYAFENLNNGTNPADDNTALGYAAGRTNTIYSQCTFVGSGADASANNLTNSGTFGYNAKVGISNAHVWGSNNVLYHSFGGRSDPRATVHISKAASGALGPTLLIENSSGGGNAEARIDITTFDNSTLVSPASSDPSFRLKVIDQGNYYSNAIFQTRSPSASATNPLQDRFGFLNNYTKNYEQIVNWNNTYANKRIAFYETVANDHQFVGFGCNNISAGANSLRAQIDSVNSFYDIYAATSATASNLISRLTGAGNHLLSGTQFASYPKACLGASGTATTTMTTANVFQRASLPTTNSTIYNNFFAFDTVTQTFTYTGTQTQDFFVSFAINATHSGANAEVTTFTIYRNNAASNFTRPNILKNGGGAIGNADLAGMFTLNTNDTINLFCAHSVAGRTLTVSSVQIIIQSC